MHSLVLRIHPSIAPVGAVSLDSVVRCPVELLEWSSHDTPLTQLVAAEEVAFDLTPTSPLGRLNGPLVRTLDEAALRAAGTELLATLATGARAAILGRYTKLPPRLAGVHPAPPMRLALDVREPLLRGLPWESLCTGAQFLVLNEDRPMTRAELTDPPVILAPTPRPLTILLAVLCDPADVDIAWKQEVEAIEDVAARSAPFVRLIVRGVRTRTSAAEIAASIAENRPHILHLIGHGVPAMPGVEAMLRVTTVAGDESITASAFRTMLASSVPHLAYINACHGAVGAQAGLWTLTQPFLEAGAPAVIGMNGAINGVTAAALAASFYSSLLIDQQPIDVALSIARRTALKGQSMSPDAAMPTLVVQTHPECVLRPRCDRATHTRVTTKPHLDCGAHFVGRWRERLGTVRDVNALDAAPSATQLDRSVYLVHGVTRIGKSDFTRVILRYLATEGWHVAYLPLAGRPPIEAVGLLKMARDAFGQSVHPAHEIADAFTRFDRTLQTFNHEDPVGTLFEYFRAGLAALSAVRPTVLAVDAPLAPNGGVLPDSWHKYVLPFLVTPAMHGSIEKAKLILCATTSDLPLLGLDPIPDGVQQICLPHFTPAESESEIGQWLLQVLGREQQIRYLNLSSFPCFQQNWTPGDLQKIAGQLLLLKGGDS